MLIAFFDKTLLTFSIQRFKVRRESLGDQLFAAVVVVRGIALEPVKWLA